MNPWKGKRPIAVVTACMTADGLPTFAFHRVAVTHDEAENGTHYDRVEGLLVAAGYDEPFVFFDEFEAPAFLHPAVLATVTAHHLTHEESTCPASSS